MKKNEFELTEEQLRGLDIDSEMGMVAGAGSGKTLVLTMRFVELLKRAKENGLSPEAALRSIVAMTYTRKAAAEMAERVAKKCEELSLCEGGEFWHELAVRMAEAKIGTIHSFCGSIARRYPFQSGFNPSGREDRYNSNDIEILVNEFVLKEVPKEFFKTLKRKSLVDTLKIAYSKRSILSAELRRINEETDLLKHWSERSSEFDFELRGGYFDRMRWVYEQACKAKTGDKIADRIVKLGEPPSENSPEAYDYLKSFTSIVLIGGSSGNWDVNLDEIKNEIKTYRKRYDTIKVFIPQPTNQTDQANLAVTVGFANLFSEFRSFADDHLSRQGILDFDEMIISADRLLEDSALLDDIAGGVNSLLIDEFQDTDPLQWRVASRLGGKIRGKLFWVGDPKQSIYRFRGADVENVARGKRWITDRGGQINQLTKNYRTSKGVLDFINKLGQSLFKPSEMQFDFMAEEQSLELGRDSTASGTVEIIYASDEKQVSEFELIARRIENIVRGIDSERLSIVRGKEVCPAEWRDISVLLPSLKRTDQLRAQLQKKGIPHIQIGGKGFFTTEEVSFASSFVHHIADSRDQVSLINLLRSPIFGLTDRSIFLAYNLGDKDFLSGLEALLNRHTEESAVIRRAFDILTELKALSAEFPPSKLIGKALIRTGAWMFYSAMPNGRQMVANLEKFLEICAAYDSKGIFCLSEALRTNSSSEEAEETVEFEGSDAVRIMTIHQAKGLEFPITIVAELGRKGRTDSDTLLYDPKIGAVLKADYSKGEKGAIWERVSKLESLRAEEEKKRILYVAASRARDHLILSTNNWSCSYSAYIAELIQEPNETTIEIGSPVRVRLNIEACPSEMYKKTCDFQPVYFSEDLKDISSAKPPIEIQPISPTRTHFHLRATDLPGWKSKVVFEAGSADGKQIGTAIHDFFETLPCPLPSQNDLIQRASAIAEKFPEIETGTLLEIAESPVVRELFIAKPESDFREYRMVLRVGGLIITGVIDRLWRDESGWHIVDFKSDASSDRAGKLIHYAPQLAVYRRAVAKAMNLAESEISASILFTRTPVELVPLNDFDLDTFLAEVEMTLK